MKCPICGSQVRPSKKYPGKYLCDKCHKRFPESSVIDKSVIDKNKATAAIKPKPTPLPSVGKKKKRRIWPWGLLVIIVLIAALTAACFIFPDKANTILGALGISNIQKSAEEETGQDYSTFHEIGETADYNNIEATILGYEESTGNEWAVPAEGNIFVLINMSITNHTEEELTVSSMASFEGYCNGAKLDYSSNAFTVLATSTDKQKLDGSLAVGETLSGYLCLEVPADWTSLEIHYSDKVWSEKTIKFQITK